MTATPEGADRSFSGSRGLCWESQANSPIGEEEARPELASKAPVPEPLPLAKPGPTELSDYFASRWSFSKSVESDGGAIARSCLFHEMSFQPARLWAWRCHPLRRAESLKLIALPALCLTLPDSSLL